jgi:hypothetical protein
MVGRREIEIIREAILFSLRARHVSAEEKAVLEEFASGALNEMRRIDADERESSNAPATVDDLDDLAPAPAAPPDPNTDTN